MDISIGSVLLVIAGALAVLVLLFVLFMVLSIFGIVRGAKELIDTTNDGVRVGKKGYSFAQKKIHEHKARSNDGKKGD